ncbi:MAG: maleate isomerase [Chloroflexota bacterium]|jgi:maleate cis-trans isomerase|nr:maleate isomerase [Chloroflexota bacterium]
MAAPQPARIGFVSNRTYQGAHYGQLLALVPPDVTVEIAPLGQEGRSSYDRAGTADEHVIRTSAAARAHGWQAVVCTGAPMQMSNPGFLEQLREALDIPATTAVEASGTALRALGVRRTLLLTPFRRSMNDLIGEYLASLGVEALVRQEDFDDVDEGSRMTPDEVYDQAVGAFRAAPGAEAIYFQGAVMDPIPVLDRLETDLGVPVVASNPAMLWRSLSLLGRRYSLEGGGRLLREWPAE